MINNEDSKILKSNIESLEANKENDSKEKNITNDKIELEKIEDKKEEKRNLNDEVKNEKEENKKNVISIPILSFEEKENKKEKEEIKCENKEIKENITNEKEKNDNNNNKFNNEKGLIEKTLEKEKKKEEKEEKEPLKEEKEKEKGKEKEKEEEKEEEKEKEKEEEKEEEEKKENSENSINTIKSPEKIEMTEEYINKFLTFISEIKKSSFSKPFKKPALKHLHGTFLKNKYKEMIKKPMDLELVTKKLKLKEYTNVQEFINDIFLIFNNAMLFNKENSKIYDFAKSLKIKAQLKFEEMKFLPVSGVVRELKNKRYDKKEKSDNTISENDNEYVNYKDKLLNKKKNSRYNYSFDKFIYTRSKDKNIINPFEEKNNEIIKKNNLIEENKNVYKKKKKKEKIRKIKIIEKKIVHEIKKENKGVNTISENLIFENNLFHDKEKIKISKMIEKLSDNEIIDVLTYLTHSCNVLSNVNEKTQDCIIIDFDKFNDENYSNLIDYLELIQEKKHLKNSSQINYDLNDNFE